MPPRNADEEFHLALNAVRDSYGLDSVCDDDLNDIIATEESRVADAAVLAELISARLAVALPTPPPAATAPLRPPATFQSTPSPPTPVPAPSGASSPRLDVADLIDGMLAQEKRETKTSKKH